MIYNYTLLRGIIKGYSKLSLSQTSVKELGLQRNECLQEEKRKTFREAFITTN